MFLRHVKGLVLLEKLPVMCDSRQLLTEGMILRIPASQNVFPDLFHSSLRFSSNFTKIDSQTNETVAPALSCFPLLNVPGDFWTNFLVKPTADRNFAYPTSSTKTLMLL